MKARGDLSTRVGRGVFWHTVGQLLRNGVTFVISILLARLLPPSDFGTVAMALVVSELAAVIDDLGLRKALIRSGDVHDAHRATAFWTNLATNVVTGGVLVVSSPWVADFFSDPQVSPILVVLAARFPILALGFGSGTELLRTMNFSVLARIQVASALVGGVAGLALAWAGAGAWALVGQSVLSAAVTSAMNLASAPWMPPFRFDGTALRDLLRFGLPLLGTELTTYAARNVDNLVVGRYLGDTALGLYSRSYSFIYIFLRPPRLLANVLFPALATLKGDADRAARVYLRAVGVVSLLMFPIISGVFVLAEPFIHALLGPQWAPAVALLRIFTPVSMWQCIATLNTVLYQTSGRTDLQLRVALLGHALSVTGILLGLRWGTTGVAAGYAIANSIETLLNLKVTLGLVNLRWKSLAAELVMPGAGALIMTACVHLAFRFLPSTWGHWTTLLSLSALGAVIYSALVYLSKPPAYMDALALLRRKRPRAPSAA